MGIKAKKQMYSVPRVIGVDGVYSNNTEVFTTKNTDITSIDIARYIFDFVNILINISTKKQAQKTPTIKVRVLIIRTGFEPISQAQQLGIVFINVGLLPITVFTYQGTLLIN
jgi:hypothetical protein